MNLAATVFTLLLLLASVLLATLSTYLLVLTVAAFRSVNRRIVVPSQNRHRFLILIPAHNEERLLPNLLQSLAQVSYSRDCYAVYVVADNCTDRTAEVARIQGATVYERSDPKNRGKGYALNWLYDRLKEDSVAADAVLILDADSSVSPSFLSIMDAYLDQGATVIQAYYAVKSPEQSFSIALRYTAFAGLHYLRPLGRGTLGASAGLKGNGMVFAASILDGLSWTPDLTEDIQLHMDLLMAGQRVVFAPEATVCAEMPSSLANTESQSARWERGRLQMMRRHVPSLVRAALDAGKSGQWKRAFIMMDAMIEHLIPPFTILTAATGLVFVAAFMLLVLSSFVGPQLGIHSSVARLSGPVVVVSILALVGQMLYVAAGLRLVKAPRVVYRSLLFAPVYVFWKVRHWLSIVWGNGDSDWIRTTRNEVDSAESIGT